MVEMVFFLGNQIDNMKVVYPIHLYVFKHFAAVVR